MINTIILTIIAQSSQSIKRNHQATSFMQNLLTSNIQPRYIQNWLPSLQRRAYTSSLRPAILQCRNIMAASLADQSFQQS